MTVYRKKHEFNCERCGKKSVGTASSKYCIECKVDRMEQASRKSLNKFLNKTVL